MKIRFGFAAALTAAGALLTACGGNYYGGGGVGVGYVGPVALDDCGGFYDDYYGPIDDGCWADDGAFWYRRHGEGGWRRDGGAHFAHAAAASNMHEVHPAGPGHGYHFGGGSGHAGGADHHG
jgi:hypothetical protein